MNDERSAMARSLRALSLTLARLAERLIAMPAHLPFPRKPSEHAVMELETEILVSVARSEYDARAERTRFVDRALLGEPAWDILLDLFIHQVSGRRVSITSAGLASHVPHSTALRYCSALEVAGLVERVKSESDARVTFVRLTENGRLRVGRYLQYRARSLMLDKEELPVVAMNSPAMDDHVLRAPDCEVEEQSSENRGTTVL